MKKLTLILFCCAGLCQKNLLFAGGFKVALQGQKQIGMASIGVGFAQDAATIYFNPAGLSFVKNQVNVGANLLFPSTSFFEKGTNTIYNSESQTFTPFSLYGSCSLSKSVKFGMGLYTPFGTGVKYPTDWAGRYIIHQISLQTVYAQPTLSWKVADNFSLGAGFIYSFGNVLIEKDIPVTSNQGDAIASAQLKGKGHGFGFNAGAYLQATENLSVGLTYHSRVNMKVNDGKAVFSNIPVGLASTFPSNNTFSSKLALPGEVGFGFSYKIVKDLTVAVDFNHTFWSSYDSLGFNYAVNTSAVTDAKSPRLYENASCVRFGAQYAASPKVSVRAGLFFDQTPVRDGYVSPELPDNNKTGLTAGGTFKLDESFILDISLLYENVPSRAQKNIESGLDGTFQTRVIAPGLGLTYIFNKSNKTTLK